MKYPIELEITDNCWLKCSYCPNKFYKDKGFMLEEDFYSIIDYIYANIDNILFLDLSGIWDIFLHPKIWVFLKYLSKKFSNTWFEILIPTKWVSINDKHISILQKISEDWLNFNLSIWIYSIVEKKHDNISWVKCFSNIILFLKKLKKYNIPFSLELLINEYSIKELPYFYKLGGILWVNYKVHNFHNFGGSIKEKWLDKLNSKDYKLKCSFADDETYWLDFYCKYVLPFISKDSFLYFCSHWGKQNKYKWENILFLIKKYPNYLDLLEYIKKKLNKNICKDCTYLSYNK